MAIDYRVIADEIRNRSQSGSSSAAPIDYAAIAEEVRSGAAAPSPAWIPGLAASIGGGLVKGAARTALGAAALSPRAVDVWLSLPAGTAARRIPEIRETLEPRDPAERAAMNVEQAAEYLVGPAKIKGALGALKAGATAAGITAAHGGGKGEIAAAGVLSAIPAGQAVTGTAKWAGEKMYRAAIKPLVSAAKRLPKEGKDQGYNALTEQMLRWMLNTGATSREKILGRLRSAEKALEEDPAFKEALTDEPQRALRYVRALRHRAEHMLSLGRDRAAVLKGKERELKRGRLGETVTKTVMKKVEVSSAKLGIPGKSFMIPMEMPVRVLRKSTPAKEALAAARESSKWQTRGRWGELQKSGAVEAEKAAERAARDAVKAAVPGAAPLLREQSMALRALEQLDRAQFRQANADLFSLVGANLAAGEIARGRVPLASIIWNFLRATSGPLGVGLYRGGRFLGDRPGATAAAQRLGVGTLAGLLAEGRTAEEAQ